MRQEEQLVSVAALGDPIRRALYDYVVAQGRPVSRDEASEELHIPRHNVKFHLDRLEDEGLLAVEYHRPEGRRGPGAGRPAKFYRRAPRQIAISLPERHYDVAGQLMAQAITATRSGGRLAAALQDAARTYGRGLAERAVARVKARASRKALVHAVQEVLAESGYEPHASACGLVLSNCPFHTLAQEHTALVCGMNHDLLTGLVDELPAARLRADLEPAEGRCCVLLTDVPG
jgi:predicted ArsR family transcriptional regulator